MYYYYIITLTGCKVNMLTRIVLIGLYLFNTNYGDLRLEKIYISAMLN